MTPTLVFWWSICGFVAPVLIWVAIVVIVGDRQLDLLSKEVRTEALAVALTDRRLLRRAVSQKEYREITIFVAAVFTADGINFYSKGVRILDTSYTQIEEFRFGYPNWFYYLSGINTGLAADPLMLKMWGSKRMFQLLTWKDWPYRRRLGTWETEKIRSALGDKAV